MFIPRLFINIILGVVMGFLLAMIFSGRTTGQEGILPSLRIPLSGGYIHVHHWMWASLLLLVFILVGLLRINMRKNRIYPIIIGILIGVILQGVLMYSDWHKIIYFSS